MVSDEDYQPHRIVSLASPALTTTGWAWKTPPLDRSGQECAPSCPLWEDCRIQVAAGNHAGCEAVFEDEIIWPDGEPDRWLTLQEAAAILKCHTLTLARMVKRGILQARGKGRQTVIRASEVEALAELSGGLPWQRAAAILREQRKRQAKGDTDDWR